MTYAPIVCVHPSSEVAVVSDSLAEMLYYMRDTNIHTDRDTLTPPTQITRLHARTHKHRHKHADTP